MKNRESQPTGRLRLRHLQEVTEAAEEMCEERPRFEALAKEESAPRAVSAFNLFQTPDAIAEKLVHAVGGPLTGRILEPSAGLGRLYRAIRRTSSASAVLVEIAPQLCAELYREIEGDAGASLVQGDFLECDAERLGGLFDIVVMNPPFKQGRDIKHIKHGIDLLKPGGRLVSLCFDGVRQRKHLRPMVDTWEPLPPSSFEGTRAGVVLVTYQQA